MTVVARTRSGVVAARRRPAVRARRRRPGDAVDGAGAARLPADAPRGLGRPRRARTRSRCARTSSSSSPTTSAGTRPTARTRHRRRRRHAAARAPSSRDQGVEFTRGVHDDAALLPEPLEHPRRAATRTAPASTRTAATTAAPTTSTTRQTIATWLQGAGYRTSLIGKYLNGYPQLWTTGTSRRTCRRAGPSGAACRTSRFFDYIIVEPDGLGGYVEVPYGSAEADYSTDVLREKAKTFISDSVAARRAVLPLPRVQGAAPAADPGAAARGPVPEHPAVAAAELQRGRRLRQAELGAERCALAELAPSSTRSASTSSRCCRRSTRRSAAAPTFGITGIMEHLRNLGVADDTHRRLLRRQRLVLGRAPPAREEQPVRGGDPLADVRPLPEARAAAAHRRRASRSTSTSRRRSPSSPASACRSLHDGESLVRVLDGTAPTWRTDFLTEGWPDTIRGRTVREAQWKYTELPVDPGRPGDHLRDASSTICSPIPTS